MPKFAVEKIKEIDGKVNFFKLLIDGVWLYDSFCANLTEEGGYDSELRKVQALMQEVSEMKSLPQTKGKPLKGNSNSVKEFEIKTKTLRIYLIHEENTGKIIVLGGKKTTQNKDITRFRGIVTQYLNSKKTK